MNVYESIPAGGFGAVMIKQTIEHAEFSIRNMDTAEMLNAYAALKRLE